MSQFEVYPNPAGRTRVYPYVVQLQSDVATSNPRDVVVAPLAPAELLAVPEAVLLPRVSVAGHDYRVCVPMLGTVPVGKLGKPIGNVGDARWTLLAAVDRLFTGG